MRGAVAVPTVTAPPPRRQLPRQLLPPVHCLKSPMLSAQEVHSRVWSMFSGEVGLC
jgi:hypothetical protein